MKRVREVWDMYHSQCSEVPEEDKVDRRATLERKLQTFLS